jgi:hypothetical protein
MYEGRTESHGQQFFVKYENSPFCKIPFQPSEDTDALLYIILYILYSEELLNVQCVF